MENAAVEQASAGYNWLVANGMNVLYAILIIVIAFWLAGFVKKMISKIAASNEALDETLFEFLGSLAKYAILTFATIMVLERFGVTTTSLVALIGAAGLAIGLALQGTLSNLAAGVMLLLFRPFKIGDFINGADIFGQVKSISLFTTEVGTFDHQHIIIPNSALWGSTLINHSTEEVRGVDMTFGVSYSSDLKKAEKAIRKVLSAHEHVMKDPEPFIAVDKLNESSVDFIVRPFCNGEHYFDLRYSLPQLVKEEFDRQKIEIPFPHRKIIMQK